MFLSLCCSSESDQGVCLIFASDEPGVQVEPGNSLPSAVEDVRSPTPVKNVQISQPAPPRKRSREESPARLASPFVRSSNRLGVGSFVGPRASPMPRYSQGSPVASTIKWSSETFRSIHSSPLHHRMPCVNMPSPMYGPTATTPQTPRSSHTPPLKRFKPRKLSLSFWNKGLDPKHGKSAACG